MTEETDEPTHEDTKADLVIARAHVDALQRTIGEMVHPPDAPMTGEEQRLQLSVLRDELTEKQWCVDELRARMKKVADYLEEWRDPDADTMRPGPPKDWMAKIKEALETFSDEASALTSPVELYGTFGPRI